MVRAPVRSLPLLVAAAALLLVSACASLAPAQATTPSPTATNGPTITPPSATAATFPTCQSHQLGVVVAGAGAAMGRVLDYVWVLNRMNRPCTFVGYATVQLLDGQMRPLPTHQQQVTSAYTFGNLQPQQVVLAGSGGRAVFLLQWTDFPVTTGQSCSVAAYLRLTLPGTQTALVTDAQIGPCGGDVVTSPLVAPSALPSTPA
jgi:hypothetical protein